jgi:hypothetical protein
VIGISGCILSQAKAFSALYRFYSLKKSYRIYVQLSSHSFQKKAYSSAVFEEGAKIIHEKWKNGFTYTL